jgi:uncharacterized protein YutE (UPF0331/DUF86 family)
MFKKSFTVARMVDRILLERILSEITSEVNDLKNATDITWEVYKTDKRARRFVERTLHVIIEACIDIGHHIISDEKMREPSSYRDTFAVLSENDVLRPGDLERFENMASFRNLLVHYYERIDNEVVYGIFRKDLADFEFFVERIVEYLIRINQGVGDS